MENPNNFDPDTFGGSDLTPPNNNASQPTIWGGLGIGGALDSLFDNSGTIAGIFSQDYRDDQLALIQAQNNAYTNALSLQNGQRQTKPNYTLYIAIAVVILLAIYLLTRKK